MAKLAKAKANNGKSKEKANSKDSDDQNSISDYDESENSEEEDEDEDDDEDGDGDGIEKKKNNDAKAKKESSFASDCKKLFGKTNLYEILGVQKDCQLIEIKKAYHKLSLKVHPDKVKDEHKEEAKSKFQTLGKVYSVLSDAEKRKIYDETGVVDDHDFVSTTTDWNSYWRALFKRISEEDISDFFKNYKDSPTEKTDLLKLYEKHKGDMDLIVEEMFCNSILEDEERFRQIIKDAIEKKEVEAFDDFTNESDKKKQKRKNKYEKEAEEAEVLKKELGLDDDLKKAISQKNENRKKVAETFLKNLEEKYSKPSRAKAQAKRPKRDEISDDDDDEEDKFSDEDDSFEEEEEDDDDEDYGKSKGKSKTTKKPSPAKKPSPVKRKAAKRGKNYDDDDDEEEDKPKKQSARSKKRVSYKEEDEESEEEEDDDDDDDSFDMDDDDGDEDYGKSRKKKSPVKGKIQSKNTRAKKVKRL